MKKMLLFTFVLLFLFSCNKVPSPKETAQDVITALYHSDFATASNLVSQSSKALLDKAKKETQATMSPEEGFQFSTMTETVSDGKAEVKNDVVNVALVKEEDKWKVVLNQTLVKEIQDRDNVLATVKTNWEELLKEYEARLQVLKEYIDYKKSEGELSPNLKTLNDKIATLSHPQNWTHENLLAYVQKQGQLNKVIDNALEPSLAANTDLSLNYFLQISNASDRIKSAEGNYQPVAQKAHSSVYAPLPFETTNAVKVASN